MGGWGRGGGGGNGFNSARDARLMALAPRAHHVSLDFVVINYLTGGARSEDNAVVQQVPTPHLRLLVHLFVLLLLLSLPPPLHNRE